MGVGIKGIAQEHIDLPSFFVAGHFVMVPQKLSQWCESAVLSCDSTSNIQKCSIKCDDVVNSVIRYLHSQAKSQ